MSDNNWPGKSVSERLSWLNKELQGLFAYLAFREPYTDEHLSYAATVLQEVKARMREDIETIKVASIKDDQLNYYCDALQLSLQELNAIEEDFSNWHECMGRAMDIFVFCKKMNEL